MSDITDSENCIWVGENSSDNRSHAKTGLLFFILENNKHIRQSIRY